MPLQSSAQRIPLRFTLQPLAGHHLFCPWVAMTTLHGVQPGFKLVVSSLREEHLWAPFGLSGACTRSGRNDSAHLEKVGSDLQEISGASQHGSLMAMKTCSADSNWASMNTLHVNSCP